MTGAPPPLSRVYHGIDSKGESYSATDINRAMDRAGAGASHAPASSRENPAGASKLDVQGTAGVRDGTRLYELSMRAESCANRIIRDKDFSRLSVLGDAANMIVDAGRYGYIGGTRIPAQACKVVLQSINASLRTNWDATKVAKALLGEGYAQVKASKSVLGFSRPKLVDASTLGKICAALEDKYTNDMGLAEVIDQTLMTIRANLPQEDLQAFDNYISKVIERAPAAKFEKGTILSRIERERAIDVAMKKMERPGDAESPSTVGESYAGDVDDLADLVDGMRRNVELDYIPSQERLDSYQMERFRKASLDEQKLRETLAKQAKDKAFIDRCNANVSRAQAEHDLSRAASKAEAKATRASVGREAERRAENKRIQRAIIAGGTVSFAARMQRESQARKDQQAAAMGAATSGASQQGRSLDHATSRPDPDSLSMGSVGSMGSTYSLASMFGQMDIDAVLNAPTVGSSEGDPVNSFRIPETRIAERMQSIENRVSYQLDNHTQLPVLPTESVGPSATASATATALRDMDPAYRGS